jgi:hypothetical protein
MMRIRDCLETRPCGLRWFVLILGYCPGGVEYLSTKGDRIIKNQNYEKAIALFFSKGDHKS